MKTKLRRFQREGVKAIHYRFRGRCLLGDEMGLGKTVQAIFYFKKNPKKRPVVIVCPAFLKWNWEKEVRDHGQMRAQVLEGKKPFSRIPLNRCPVIIINYEILQYWIKYLRKIKPAIVIIDESQYIKSRSAKRTQAVRLLCEDVPHVLALSGTALVNRPAELWPTLNIVRPDLFPSFWPFATRYCKPRRRPWGWEYRGATNTKELNTLLTRELMIRRLKKDVLKDLPDKIRHVIPVQMDKPSEYKAADRNFKEWLRRQKIGKKRIRKALRAEAVVKIGVLKRLAAQQKLKAVMEWVDNFLESTDEKIILFAIHKVVIKELRQRYGKSVVIDGSTPRAKRRDIVHQFNSDPKCRVLIGQLNATSVGWSAKACSHIGIVEFGWTPGEHDQAEARVHGIGRGKQGTTSEIHYFVAKETIEEKICAIIQAKSSVIHAVLDGQEVSDMDLLDQLLRSYKHGK